MTRSQASSRRGEPAQWVISAWTTGGNVPDSTVRLAVTPAAESAKFSFGCGSNDGTASCDLGAMDAKSAKRQLQAQVTVPAGASTVTSVVLSAIGSAARLPKDPVASAKVAITAAARTTTPFPVTSLPAIPAASFPTARPTLSPGGNAANLFPALQPSADPSPARKASARPVADTSALPEGSPVVGAQLAGLAALGLAFILAVTRLSIRRRPVPAQPIPPASAAAKPEPTAQAEEAEEAEQASTPDETPDES